MQIYIRKDLFMGKDSYVYIYYIYTSSIKKIALVAEDDFQSWI